MGFNKKVLSKAVSELDKAKAPAKPRDITVDPMGYWNPANQGQPVRVPGGDDIKGVDITMHNVNQPIWAQPNVGPGAIMYPEDNRHFSGASYVDETPIGRKGGTLKSKRYSKSMSATNKLFTKNKLFQNKKSKIFDPNAKFKSGGSKLGPINLNPNPLSHYELNYGFNLPTKEDGGENEDEYMDLTDEEIQAYRDGGYVVEEAPEYEEGGYVQHELVKAQKGREILPPTAADSSAILKNALAIEKYYKKYTKQIDGETKSPPNVFKILDDQNKQKKKQQMFGITTLTPQGERLLSNTEYHKNVDNNKFYQRESANETLDTNAPMTLYDRRIKPQTTTSLQNNDKTDKLMGDVVVFEKYDPLAITPASQLSNAQVKIRYKKYGSSGLPLSRLQELGLVKTKIKPITIEESDKINTLPLRPIQQFATPEQTIIPSKPYVKAVKPSANKGVWSGGSEEQFPTGLNTSDWERKTREYQQQQRANKPIAKAQTGLTISDPKEFAYRNKMYGDSLKLYNAYQMQDKLMGPGNTKTKSDLKWSTKELQEGRKKKMVRGLSYPIADDYQNEKDQFEGGFNKYSARPQDLKLIKYYKSLGFTDKDIMYHSSPDIVSDKIRPIGTYSDGTASSPIYKKPVQPVTLKNGITNINYTKSKITPSKKDDFIGIPQRKKFESPTTHFEKQKTDDSIITDTDIVPEGYRRVGNLYTASRDEKTGKVTEKEKFMHELIPHLNPKQLQQSTLPQQNIIPGKPYIKPKPNVGPRYGSLAGDENLDLPSNYTQAEREAARRQRDAQEYQRKNLEYQEQQRGNEPVAQMRKQGGVLDTYQKKGEVKTFKRDIKDQDAQSNIGWSSAPVEKKKVQPTAKQKQAQKSFDKDFKVTNKSKYEKTEDKITSEQQKLKDFGKEKGIQITNADLENVANQQWSFAGVDQQDRPGPDMIQATPEQSNSSRAWEYMTNPMTAAEYAISGGGAENMPHNINEMRIAGFDPGVVQGRNLVGNTLNSSLNLLDAGDKVARNAYRGKYGDAALEALRFTPGSGLLDDAVRLGIKPGAKYLGKRLGTETGLLSINAKELPGSPNTFKSEIDWANWNAEIPNNQTLMSEYAKIEKAAKTNGTWMKNSDGTIFNGTPEQFVQQNSVNFKNAFGDSYVTGYHGSNKGNIQEFRKGKVGDLEDGVYLANSPKDADSYRLKLNPVSKRYELAAKTENPLTFNAKNKLWTKLDHDELVNRIGQENFNALGIKPKKKYDTAEVTDIAKKLGYDAVNFENIKDAGMYAGFNGDIIRGLRTPINKNNYSIINPKNIKSLLGNNGMFDMTNPNIYKALAPLIVGTGALQQEKNGGAITEAWEDELDDHTIKLLRKAGYIVEDLD